MASRTDEREALIRAVHSILMLWEVVGIVNHVLSMGGALTFGILRLDEQKCRSDLTSLLPSPLPAFFFLFSLSSILRLNHHTTISPLLMSALDDVSTRPPQ